MDAAQLDAPELAQRMRIAPDAYLRHEKLVEEDFVISRDYQDPAMQVGVMGDFAGASAEFGELVCFEAVAGLVEFIRKLESA